MSSVFHAANAQRVTQPRGKGRKAKLWLAAYWAGWLKAKVEGRRAEPWTGSAECLGRSPAFGGSHPCIRPTDLFNPIVVAN